MNCNKNNLVVDYVTHEESCDHDHMCDFIVKHLYDPEQPGVMLVKSLLAPQEAYGAANELAQNQRNFVSRPAHYGTTKQGLASWSFEETVMPNYNYLSKLSQRHQKLRENLKQRLPFSYHYDHHDVNSIYYEAGSCGIGPHRDNSFSVNLIAIHMIQGSNQFFTAKDKLRTDERSFDVQPGDLILMRGPRNEREHNLRPIHYVKSVQEDRYVVVYREINNALQNKVHRDHQYNA